MLGASGRGSNGEGYRFIGRPLTVLLWIHSSVEKRGKEITVRQWGRIGQFRRRRKCVRVPARGDAADLLARPDGALLQGLGSLQLALAAVQGPQVPQGGVHCRAGRRKKNKNKKKSKDD